VLAIAGGVLYFSGTDGFSACVPWRSDGTADGTERLESRETRGADERWPNDFVALGDRAFFGTGAGLWTVDASSRGIRLVHALPGAGLITVAGDRLFFLAAAEGGEALWVSDGEIGGEARQLQFLPLTPCDDCDPPVRFLKGYDGGVVFPVNDHSLWRSDGTPQGTYRIASLPHPAWLGATGYPLPQDFFALGSRLLFAARRETGWSQLWVAPPRSSAALLEGCPKGCPIVTSPLQPLSDGRRVVFTGHTFRSPEALWVSDGTAAGTRPLAGLCPESGCTSELTGFVALGDAVYFGIGDAAGPALWWTDGTPQGTVLLARVALPVHPGGTLLGDQALLGVSNGVRISELWGTDGSPAGTRRVRTFARAAASSNPAFFPFGDGVLFTATQDGSAFGWWRSDGTSTRKLTSFCGACFSATQPVAAGGLVFTLVGRLEDPGINAPHLFRTDGTREGTREVLALDSDSFAQSLFAFGEKVFFVRCGPDDVEPESTFRRCDLWPSDGTSAGTGPPIALPVTTGVSPPVVVGGSFYFTLFTKDGFLIDQSDGTPAGTRRIASTGLYSAPQEIVAASGNVFVAVEGALGRLDAAAPGGVSFLPGIYSVTGLTELGGRLLFFGSDGVDSDRAGLWSTDGTPEGTRLLAPVLPPYPYLGPPEWTRLGSRLVFRGLDPDHGFELWATDGTAEGTVLLKDIAPGKASSFPSSLVRVGDQVWLTADDGDHGRELWVTGGTPDGTRLAVELAPGPFSLEPEALTLGGGSLFFSADSLFNGREPWVLPLQ
jgi:ELWxxDGT repeat protein